MTPKELQEFNNLLAQYNNQLSVTKDEYLKIIKFSNEYIKTLNSSIEQQKKMRTGVSGLADQLKKIAETQRDIKSYEKEKLRINKAMATATDAELKTYVKISKELDKQIDSLKEQKRIYEENYRVVNKTGIILKDIAKSVGNLPKTMEKAFGYIKGSGVFEMDKAIKTTALKMGLLGQGTKDLYNNINSAQDSAIQMGVTIQELAESQTAYSDELGRSVLLGEKGLNAVSELAKGTGLAADAAARLTAEMNTQGLSAEKTRDFVEQTMNDASQMGLNASKVVKNIQNNIKLLNKYNFKQGVKGLAKMAEEVSKLGIEMTDIAPMADKLWNIEGAVEMSAQLQVLGGKWSALADPFKLMYMARNDMEGLTKAIADAASESASFDEDGNIQLASVEMSRLREVAEKTGVSYDSLATAAKKMAQFKKIKTQISLSGLNDKEMKLLENTAQLDENGKAFIEIGGKPQYLNSIDGNTKALIDAKTKETANLKDRAKAAMSFDEQVSSLITQFKQYLLPLAQELSKANGPDGAITKFQAWLEKEKIGDKIKTAAKWLGETINGFLSFAAAHPYATIATVLAGKAAMWIGNGLLLATGFKMGTEGLSSVLGKGFARVAGPLMATAAAGVTGGIIGKSLGKMATEASGRKSTEAGDNWGTGLAVAGGLLGLALAPFTGGASLALTAAAVGGGALVGGLGGKYFGDMANQEETQSSTTIAANDAVVNFNPKDKFMKVNDSTMIAGTNENGNQSLAKAILNSKPGPREETSNSSMKVELGNLNISGTIELKINGETAKDFGKDLLNNPMFIRDITKMVHMATASAVSGRQPQKIG